MNTCLIRQPAGIGDIFFTQKIAKLILDKGKCDEIIWPVLDEFAYLGQYLTDPKIYYVNERSNFPYKHIYESGITNVVRDDDLLYIPLQYSDKPYPDIPVLDSKYKLVNLDYDNWLDYFLFVRNHDRENSLFNDVLSLKDGDQYALVNRLYGSPPHSVKSEQVVYDTDKKIVELDYFDGYNIFDWCKTIENACEIYFVDTCFTYLFEKLDLKAKRIDLFSRLPGTPTYDSTKYIFKKKYNWM